MPLEPRYPQDAFTLCDSSPCTLRCPSRPDTHTTHARSYASAEIDFVIDNLLVRIHLIIEMIIVDRPCAMGV